ncbi:MAG: ABC transporter ATP-binding protein [Rhodospirillales bacterium]|nr:ABC transporter ATP-binding protein [Rhodospirillales bacterium]
MLEVADIVAGYGRVLAVQGVSLSVAEREFVALVGANGAGKSTLMKVLSGLLAPKSGSIRLGGRELAGSGAEEAVAAGIVLVPEGRMVFPRMTVLENLLLGATNPRARKDRERSLERVFALFPRLAERRGQLARTLSGGEQQMLAIGRGLMALPRILILDEPSLGLSPLLVQETYKALQRLNADGLTILLAEQNVRLSLAVSTRGYVMEHGRIVLAGASAKLADDPATRKAYLGL